MHAPVAVPSPFARSPLHRWARVGGTTRAAGLVAALSLLVGCEVTHALGGRLDKVVEDAGAGREPDASLIPDALREPVLKEPGGTEEEFVALRKAIVGDWWGKTSYNEKLSDPFEVHFDSDGTYSTRCVAGTDALCEPFGIGSDGDKGLRWELFTLDPDGAGEGIIQSEFELPPWPSTTLENSFINVRYREKDKSLSFLLADTIYSESLEPQWALVALNRGKYDSSSTAVSAEP